MANKKERKKFWTVSQLFLIAFLLSLILFFLVLGGVYRNDLKTTKSLASETISFLEDSCQRYENSALDATTESLQDVLGETLTLKNHIDESKLTDTDFLSQYANEQNLTGILILDKDMNQKAGITLSGTDAYTLWKSQIQNYNQNQFSEHANKTLSDRVTLHNTTYDVAIAFRDDTSELILCYKDTAKEKTDHYSLSFDSLLTDNTFYKNPRIVITDNKHILATNIPGLQHLSTKNTNSTPSGWSADNLIRLKFNHSTWYGLRKVYGTYYIYAFYSTNEIFSNLIPVTASAIAFYAIAYMIILMIRQHYQQELHLKQQKQIRTIKAIASLYSSTALVNLETHTTEPIHLSPQLSQVLKSNRNTSQMLDLIHDCIIAPEYRERFAAFANLDTLSSRLKGKGSLTCIYPDISGTWYITYLIPEKTDDNGTVTAALIASRNINDYISKEEAYKEELRQTAKDAELANAAKTTFLRRMSHDIRTPINGIRGMTAIARQNLHAPDELNICLDKILSSSDYLLDLVNDVLRMSKLESGKVLLEEKSFDLEDLLTETVSFIKVQADDKGIELLDKTFDIQHRRLIGSPLHIRQIIQNIMTNAIKYTPSGGSICINCKEISSDSEHAIYEFTCSDTGIGMSEEFQARAFEPFVQEHNDARTTYNGIGLGLSIVKDLVERMNGQIRMTSQKDVGTTFVITLQLKIDSSITTTSQEIEHSQISIAGTRILLVEDNELNTEIASSLLRAEGAVITEARNGQEALDFFRQSAPGTYQIILMDIMMPVMDGLTAARKIRMLDRPDARSVPIFAMTANSFVEDIRQSEEAGMNEHFSKPLDMEALVRKIYQYSRCLMH